MAYAVYETDDDVRKMIDVFSKHFETVRIVNPILAEVTCCHHGEGQSCFDIWKKNVRCSNCVSARVAITGEPAHKFEQVGNIMYIVTSEKVSTPQGFRVLELVSKMDLRFARFYSEQKEEYASLEELTVMAYQDPLTGVFNRRYAYEHLEQLVSAEAEREGDLLVALLDIDNLKAANDRWGHAAGDALITTVVSQALSALDIIDEEHGFFARTGGDEFVIVMHLDDITDEGALLQKVLDNINAGCVNKFPDMGVSASLGAMLMSECDKEITLDNLMEVADRRLYSSKRAGRSRYSLDDEHLFDPPAKPEGEKRKYRRDEPFIREDE